MLNNVAGALGDRMKVIWYNWIAILLLVFCYTISAFAAAVGSPSKAYGFMAIWNCLLLIGYSVGGTLILRNIAYRTPLAVGFLIGVGLMLINILLEITAVSESPAVTTTTSATMAVSAFSILLVMAYTTFTVFVTLYRDTLLPPPSMASQDTESLPPPQFGSAPGGVGYGGYGGSSYGGQGGDAGGMEAGATGHYGNDEHGDASKGAPTGPGVL